MLTKLLVLTTSYPVKSNPQSGVFVQYLVDSLSVAGYSCEVVVPADPSGVCDNNDDRTKVHCLKYAPSRKRTLAHKEGGIPESISRSRLNLLFAGSLVFSFVSFLALNGRKHDVILANWAVCGAIAGLCRLFVRKPVITVLRGSDVSSAQSGVRRFFLKTAIRYSDFVVCVSKSMAENLKEIFPYAASKIRCIENGVYSFDSLSSYSIRPIEAQLCLRLLFVGNLTLNKNTAVIVQALALLNSKDLILDIVGDGKERERLETLVGRYGLSEQVRFHGRVRPEEVARFYKDSDVLVQSSFSEGRSNVLLEAMSEGLCIVASNIVANTAVLGDEASKLIFSPESPKELAVHLKTLLGDRTLLEEMKYASLHRARKSFSSWNGCAEKYDYLIRECLS